MSPVDRAYLLGQLCRRARLAGVPALLRFDDLADALRAGWAAG